ncbi:S-layer homology domain-containing protein [Paenibacillus sp. GYB003]|uniref:S-layer homology domain-containing protein n=1 Tax=Paenibacillus sp. GYB003 TaxID=2994392 RepID=UPI002F967167
MTQKLYTATISRAEMVTMLIRGWNMSATITATSFADDADIPEWAKGFVAKAEKEGIVEGRSNNRFEPSNTATRAEATVVLDRMLKDNMASYWLT